MIADLPLLEPVPKPVFGSFALPVLKRGLLALLFVGVSGSARGAVVSMLDGSSAEGQIETWNDGWLILQTSDGARRIGREELLSVQFPEHSAAPGGAPGAKAELTDGSVLWGSECQTIGSEKLHFKVAGSSVTVPVAQIANVRFSQENSSLEQQWKNICETNAAADLLVVRKGDSLDYLEGRVLEVADARIHFELDGEEIPVRRSKVEGIVYFHANRSKKLSEPIAEVHGTLGTLIRARSIARVGEIFQIESLSGTRFDLPLTKISKVDLAFGKIRYLSDLTPRSSRWTPLIGLSELSNLLKKSFLPRLDRSIEGGPLRLAGKEYSKGVAVQSRTELVYRLPSGYSRFLATVGIDDSLASGGHVMLLIRGDDRALFHGAVAGSDAPIELDLDIAGVKDLTILVDFGEDLNTADHLDLASARISK